MALTKTNYKLSNLGITLDKAYAIIHNLEISGSIGIAEFYIQNAPRDNAINLTPFKKETVRFIVNRSENPFTTAYNEAKGTHKEKQYDSETGEVKDVDIPNVFNGWEDDIVNE